MWTTWMCLLVAVPADPRILAGRRFWRISPDIRRNISSHISPGRGVAETAEIWFHLHRDFREAEIGILSTQRIDGGDID